MDDVDSVMTKHGYKSHGSIGGYGMDMIYKHPQHGHTLTYFSDGEWHFKHGSRTTSGSSVGRSRIGFGHEELDEHLSKVHGGSQHSEDDAPGNVSLSRHHVALKKKGYRFVGTSNNGWTAHYKHSSGRTARIEWQTGSDLHGTVHHGGAQQYTEQITPEQAREFVAQTPGGWIKSKQS